MNETQVLLTFGDFTVTAFGLCVALGAALAVVITVLLGRKNPGVNSCLSLSMATALGAVLGARVLYCLTMLDFILVDLGGAEFIPQLWQGGFTLYGAVLGGGAGAWIYAKVTKKNLARVLDVVAPGAAVVLMAERIGEYFTSQGLGDYIEDEAMMRFPFGVESAWGDWQIPVFMYEALAALIIAVVLLFMVNRRKPGRTAETFIILLGVTQILLESLREDEFIRFGFVRLNQLGAALTMAAVFFGRLIGKIKNGGWTKWQIARTVMFVGGVGIIILLEFALDKSTIDNGILYGVMAATLAMMAVAQLRDGKGIRNS